LLHELGHYIDDVRKVSARIEPNMKTSEWERAIEERHARDRLLAIVQNWLSEFASDLIACAAIGPAYFFSFADFGLINHSLDESGESHPPTRTRLTTMVQFLRDLLGRKAEPFSCHLAYWENHIAEQASPYQAPPDIAAASAALDNEVIGPLAKRVLNLAKGAVRYRDDFAEAVVSAADDIAELIPPSEYGGEPTDLITVANGAWLCYLEHSERISGLLPSGPSARNDDVSVRHKIGELAMTAVEHIYLQRAWGLTSECPES
jgi:hypothetical protein